MTFLDGRKLLKRLATQRKRVLVLPNHRRKTMSLSSRHLVSIPLTRRLVHREVVVVTGDQLADGT